MIVFHLRKKRLRYKWKHKIGDTERQTREGNASKNVGDHSLPGDSPRCHQESNPSPGWCHFMIPARRAGRRRPLFRRRRRRRLYGGGRAATVHPRAVLWRSVESYSAVLYWSRRKFEDADKHKTSWRLLVLSYYAAALLLIVEKKELHACQGKIFCFWEKLVHFHWKKTRHLWARFWRGGSFVWGLMWPLGVFGHFSFLFLWAVQSGRFLPDDPFALPDFQFLFPPRVRHK